MGRFPVGAGCLFQCILAGEADVAEQMVVQNRQAVAHAAELATVKKGLDDACEAQAAARPRKGYRGHGYLLSFRMVITSLRIIIPVEECQSRVHNENE
jgi:hypothetical protein